MAQPQDVNLLRHLRKLALAKVPSQQTDVQLLQQFSAGDEAAFAALVQRHGSMVLGVCRSVLHHHQDAEDALQATFLVLARKASTIRKQQSLSSWLHGVAYRLALKAKAQSRRHADRPVQPSVAANPLDDLTVRELHAMLHEELQRLPDKYRAVLLLCYWEGKTRDEAAEQLGWAKGTLKEQLERARNLLRGRLTRRGLLPSAALFTALLTQNASDAAVSSTLVQSTAKAAAAFANKVTLVGASTSAIALAEGALRTMQITKWTSTALVLLLLGGIVAGVGGLGFWAFSEATGRGEEVIAREQPKAEAPKEVPKQDAPNVEWNGHNKGLPKSDLKIELTPGAKVERTKTGLSLPVKITNNSKETIVTILPHEWHGGKWGTTDLYASVTRATNGKTDRDEPFRPLFQFGEREGKETDPVAIGPGKSIDGTVRMDWPGTGSLSATPLMHPNNHGTYQARLLLVFEAGEKQQYVIGAAATVELPPLPREAKLDAVKDAEAKAWLKANYSRFILRVGMHGMVADRSVKDGGSPAILRFVTDEELVKKEPGAAIFLLDEQETASIVQSLVDTGLWSRPDPVSHLIPLPMRYLHLGEPRTDKDEPSKEWRLGAIEDDISSRIIIQTLLKLGGEREKALRVWLNYRNKPVAPPERENAYVRRLLADATRDSSPFDPPGGGVVKNADQLAKLIPDKALVETIAKQVDFTKERLVAIAWTGSSGGSVRIEVKQRDQGPMVVFHKVLGKAKDKGRHYAFLYAVSYDADVAGDPAPVRRIEPAGPNLGAQTVLRSIDELSKAIPDKAMVERINSQVDFARERLVSVTWLGGASSTMSFKVLAGEKETVVVLERHRGTDKNKEIKAFLFAVANEANFRVEGYPEPPASALIRPIDLTGYQAGPPNGFTRPTSIANPDELAKAFPDKKWQAQIGKQVNFAKERLLFFAWSASGSDALTFDLHKGVVVFKYQPGETKDDVTHFRLFAIARDVAWKIDGDPQTPNAGKLFREIDLAGARPPMAANDFPTEIKQIDELTKLFPTKEFKERIKTQVDLTKDRLLLFAWWGSGEDDLSAGIAYQLKGDNLRPVVVFHHAQGKALNDKLHLRLFAIAKEATWPVEGTTQKFDEPLVRRIDLGGFAAYAPKNKMAKKPTLITNADELAKAFPKAEVQEHIRKQVNFAKEELLYFAWTGSVTDKLSYSIQFKSRENIEFPLAYFQLSPGTAKLEKGHYHLFAVTKGTPWVVGDGPPVAEPGKPAARELDR